MRIIYMEERELRMVGAMLDAYQEVYGQKPTTIEDFKRGVDGNFGKVLKDIDLNRYVFVKGEVELNKGSHYRSKDNIILIMRSPKWSNASAHPHFRLLWSLPVPIRGVLIENQSGHIWGRSLSESDVVQAFKNSGLQMPDGTVAELVPSERRLGHYRTITWSVCLGLFALLFILFTNSAFAAFTGWLGGMAFMSFLDGISFSFHFIYFGTHINQESIVQNE